MNKVKRHKLFIGHANPEDNEFTRWIQSKLLNEGYDVVTDLSMLIGGEKDFWNSIQDALENDAAKYILVLSNNTFQKDGVIDEWEQAKSIEKKEGISDFIIPLRIDDVPFDVRIGLNKRNIINFHDWSKGLKTLLKKLHFDSIPKTNQNGLSQSLVQWSKNTFTTRSGVLKKEEKFYSNWLEISGLPKYLYFHKFDNDTQSRAIADGELRYPIVQLDNHLVSFQDELDKLDLGFDLDVKPKSTSKIETQDIFDGYDSDSFPKHPEACRLLIRVLKKAWTLKLESLGLSSYELSGMRSCYYYQKGFSEKDKVRFKYEEKDKLKQLVGKMKNSFWHYGLSAHVMLHPVCCFSLKAHILFSDDGNSIWDSKSKLHSARRKKGKSFFNKEWRDLMLAFTHSLTNENGSIELKLSNTQSLLLSPQTMQFYCGYGYNDPQDNARIIPLDDYLEDDELEENYIEDEEQNFEV